MDLLALADSTPVWPSTEVFVLDRYLDEVLPGWLETALGRRQVDLLASADSTPEAALDWGRLRGVGAAGGLTPV